MDRLSLRAKRSERDLSDRIVDWCLLIGLFSPVVGGVLAAVLA